MANSTIDKINILPTTNTPEFIFNPDGGIIIRGRGFYNDKSEIPDRIIIWIEEYLKNPAEVTYVTLAFEYLNSFSTTIMVSILRNLRRLILQSRKLVIQWYYEEDDEDILERGMYISETFDIPIEFIQIKNITLI
jgi:hypothetical protein